MAQGSHHFVPLKVYTNVLIALLILTVITVAAAQFDFGHGLNTVIAIAIATVKAALVGAYFMHLKYDDKLYVVILLGSVFFLFLMWLLSYLDWFTRIAMTSTL